MARGKGRKRQAEPTEAEADPEDSSGSEAEEHQGPGRKRRRGARGNGTADRAAAVSTHLVSTFFQGQGPDAAGSGRTLADLQMEGLLGGEAGDAGEGAGGPRELLARLPTKHAAEKAALRQAHQARFGRWWNELRAGNSLLLYGFGSKHELLQRFAREQLGLGDAPQACLEVNGLHPGLTAKQVLQWTVAAQKQGKAEHYRGCTVDDLLDLLRRDEARRVYLVLHNIDGPGLRSHAAQQVLSELAHLPNVHLAASVDHVNSWLLWDQQTCDRFSWVLHNVSNYASYAREVGFAAIPSMLVGRSEECSKQSARVVLASLSDTARAVFRLVAEAQLDEEGEKGITFLRLFQLCRERFLVSTEMLLKTNLTEFKDHDLLATKRGADGGDLLHVPLSDEVLQQVLEDLDSMS